MLNLFHREERSRIFFLLPIFIFLWTATGLPITSHQIKQNLPNLLEQVIKQNLPFDLAVETLYLDQQTCELHVVLKVTQGTLPDSVFTQGRLKIKSPSLSGPSLSLDDVDPGRELNSKHQIDFNTMLILRESETVEASLENINDNKSANNRKKVSLTVPAQCQHRVSKPTVVEEEPSSQSTIIETGISRPRVRNFTFTLNDIASPKTVYVYDSYPPSHNIKVNWEAEDPEAEWIKMEICDVSSSRNVLEVIDIPITPGIPGVTALPISELWQIRPGTGEWGSFYVKARLKLRDGSLSSNSEIIRLIIGTISGYYYYQDYATRGIQCMKVNDSPGPVLISGLTEDDREGRMTITFNRSVACSREYPVMGDVQLKFYTTHEDGQIITPQSGYTIHVPAGQSSYSFTMKNIIQSMGLSWSARVYCISVETYYQCGSQSGQTPPISEWDKVSNTVNIRFFVPQPLL